MNRPSRYRVYLTWTRVITWFRTESQTEPEGFVGIELALQAAHAHPSSNPASYDLS